MTITDVVNANKGLIYKIAGNFYNVDRDDLFQAGVLGIMKAYKNYKKNGTTKFSTYAYEFIFGEMYAFVQSQNQIKVSRDILRKYKAIEMNRYSLAQKLNRIPTNEELAVYLEMDISDVIQAIDAASMVMSLDFKETEDERNIYETIPAKEGMSIDEQLTIQDGLDTLNEDEKRILEYRYFEDLTQSEVARKLNMTQVMVSRYEKKGINKMRAYYTN